ncbi:hypothetical protein [Ponticaulis profundi]|uniref:Uncharacterized protein n=1 Tax=Ponticaulis profundi TaxID=2665222 RepID=A0ABW1S868_9PROT
MSGLASLFLLMVGISAMLTAILNIETPYKHFDRKLDKKIGVTILSILFTVGGLATAIFFGPAFDFLASITNG